MRGLPAPGPRADRRFGGAGRVASSSGRGDPEAAADVPCFTRRLTMLAWKFFAPGAVAPFTGVAWPLPHGRGAGWVEARSSPGAGVHACALEDLPYWIDQELWAVELDGEVRRSRRQLVGARGRLIARVQEWPAVQAGFTGACIERTKKRVIDELLAAGRTDHATLLATPREPEAQRQVALSIAES